MQSDSMVSRLSINLIKTQAMVLGSRPNLKKVSHVKLIAIKFRIASSQDKSCRYQKQWLRISSLKSPEILIVNPQSSNVIE